MGCRKLNINGLIGGQDPNAMAKRQIYNPEHSPITQAVRVDAVDNTESPVVPGQVGEAKVNTFTFLHLHLSKLFHLSMNEIVISAT